MDLCNHFIRSVAIRSVVSVQSVSRSDVRLFNRGNNESHKDSKYRLCDEKLLQLKFDMGIFTFN